MGVSPNRNLITKLQPNRMETTSSSEEDDDDSSDDNESLSDQSSYFSND